MAITPSVLAACEPFLQAIVQAPGDGLQREIFADFLDGQFLWEEALGQRWAARNGKYPMKSGDNISLTTGGWYILAPVPMDTDYCRLPSAFAEEYSCSNITGLSMGNSPEALLNSERLFLLECAKIAWLDGEPIGRKPDDTTNPKADTRVELHSPTDPEPRTAQNRPEAAIVRTSRGVPGA